VLILFGGFGQSSYTASAKRFLDHLTVFINSDLLKVWFEFTLGSPHGVTSILTKGSLFSATFANSHGFVLSNLEL